MSPSIYSTNDQAEDRAKRRIGKSTAVAAGRFTAEAIDNLLRDSNLFSHETLDNLTRIDPAEIAVGRLLGQGGFCVVLETSRLDPSNSSHLSFDKNGQKISGYQYVIKCLDISKVRKRKKFARASADLAIEAYFLASLNHCNIINLRAITEGDIGQNVSKGSQGCFFLILDKIQETLSQRIRQWQDDARKFQCFFYRPKLQAMFNTRVGTIQQLASALYYLHSKCIIHRDLKPDNVGFDENGVVKLFDFGLAKELKLKNKHDDGTYNLTGVTGSRLYMAPEVAQSKRYNLSADVYSFGLLSWAILALEIPLMVFDLDRNQHVPHVVLEGPQAAIDINGTKCKWSIEFQSLISKCLDEVISKRPLCGEILEILMKKKAYESANIITDSSNRIQIPKFKSGLNARSA